MTDDTHFPSTFSLKRNRCRYFGFLANMVRISEFCTLMNRRGHKLGRINTSVLKPPYPMSPEVRLNLVKSDL